MCKHHNNTCVHNAKIKFLITSGGRQEEVAELDAYDRG